MVLLGRGVEAGLACLAVKRIFPPACATISATVTVINLFLLCVIVIETTFLTKVRREVSLTAYTGFPLWLLCVAAAALDNRHGVSV